MSLLFETVKALREARRLIKKGWTRRAFARDKWRHSVASDSPRAACFCAEGAINRAVALAADPCTVKDQAIIQLKKHIPPYQPQNVVSWNDHPQRTKQEVVRVFTKAIQMLESIG